MQHYMCFLQVDFTVDYVEELENPSSPHFLYVTATRWFDINSRSGREDILFNLCGIMRRAAQ